MTLKPNKLKQFFLLLVFWSQELRKGGVAWSWKSDGVATALTGSYGEARLTTGICGLCHMGSSEYLYFYGAYLPQHKPSKKSRWKLHGHCWQNFRIYITALLLHSAGRKEILTAHPDLRRGLSK